MFMVPHNHNYSSSLGSIDINTAKVSFEVGNILTHKTKVNALVVNTVAKPVACPRSGFTKTIRQLVGDKKYKTAFDNAIKERNGAAPKRGDILVLNLAPTKSTQISFKHLILVVAPTGNIMEDVFKNILNTAIDNKFTSLIISGFMCGTTNANRKKQTETAAKVFKEQSAFDPIQTITFMDQEDDKVQCYFNGFAKVFGEEEEEPDVKREKNARGYSHLPEKINNDVCCICMGDLQDPEGEEVCALICQHQFHFPCFKEYLSDFTRCFCPICRRFFCAPMGDQPLGSVMTVDKLDTILQGFPQAKGTYQISYHIPDGIQGPTHLRPGKAYRGTMRIAYLPNTPEGTKVLRLLRLAFLRRLIFTVGDSLTLGTTNVAVWNNIHHKTRMDGGIHNFGYPDATYLDRVTIELRNNGIIEDLIPIYSCEEVPQHTRV